MINKGREDRSVFGADLLVEYRLLAPEVWTPQRSHKRETEDRYITTYDPELERLEELGVIEVIHWGGNP